MKLPYKPQDIRNFFAYSYEFIDCLDFMRNPDEIIENYIEYEKFIIERIKNIGISENFYFELKQHFFNEEDETNQLNERLEEMKIAFEQLTDDYNVL